MITLVRTANSPWLLYGETPWWRDDRIPLAGYLMSCTLNLWQEKTYLKIFTARFHHTKTNGHPDTGTKLNDAKNQDHSSKSQFGFVWVYGLSVELWRHGRITNPISITKITIIFAACTSKSHTVQKDDYSTTYSRCDRKPHEYASLQNENHEINSV